MNAFSTIQPVEAANGQPEFIDYKGLRGLFSISRSHGYDLAYRGLVRTVCLRKPGAIRGKRLWEVASVRTYLNSCVTLVGSSQDHNNNNAAE